MKERIYLIVPLLISSICFFFTMNIILKEDILIVDSFNVLFFTIKTEQLSLIILVINIIFYSFVLFNILKLESNSIKSKFDFFEFIFLFPTIIFIPYLYLLIFNLNDLNLSYTNILFMLYTSLLIFGFMLFLFTIFILKVTGKLNNNSLY